MKPAVSLWFKASQVPESVAEIARRVCARYGIGVGDLRGSRGSRWVCEARKAVIAEAAANGHPHKVVAAYLGRTRSDITHAVNRWDGMR
jgi:hypothetical protein